MCGIAGIISLDNCQITKEDIISMTNSMHHRGPDGEGYYIDKNIGLGHRRLAIIDTSDAASQPFIDDDLVLVFNGAIYNYLELRKQLEDVGIVFQTDSEVLIKSYRYWCEKCCTYFNGMWAFSLYDKLNNKLFCSRDRFGIKLFYYLLNSERFIFASEIKPILNLTNIQNVEVEVLLNYLISNLSDMNNKTFFEGIVKLPAATNLIVNLDTYDFKFEKYYELEFDEKIAKLDLNSSINLVESELKRSINYRLRSDVKCVSALCGGLDSLFISAYCKKHLDDRHASIFQSISIGSIDMTNDESDFAKSLADAEDIGSDEVLLGYSRYNAAFMRSHSVVEDIKFLLKLPTHYGISVFEGVKNYFYFSKFFVPKFKLKLRARILKNKYRHQINYGKFAKLAASYKNLFELQKNELSRAQIPELLKCEDKNSMYHSIESRFPYLDYKFVEKCLSISHNYKIRNGRSEYLLRKVMQRNNLPKDITWRKKKIGFASPQNIWWPMTEEIIYTINNSTILKELLNAKILSIKDRDLQWKLYNIAVWEKIYKMKI